MDLAIVIPAYKITYLEEALNSLANQTNKNFNVYVGDDCSPYDISSVCKKYEDKMSLDYYRFDKNLGGTNLVKQWERCVSRTGKERWLWLFSDDDIADDTCVEKFYEAVSLTNGFYDVYRFNTCVIDKNNNFLSAAEDSPTIENAMDLAINILLWKRGNSMPDHIFKKEKYTELDGFVNFAQGQSSDWATSINFAYDRGLYTIAGPKVKWRYSDENVSSQATKKKKLLMVGYIQFLKWITNRFDLTSEIKFSRKLIELREASKKNFNLVVAEHYKGLPYVSIFGVSKDLNAIFRQGLFKSIWMCLSINLKRDRRNLKKAIFNKR
jgi:glycosyltransferase involved in cell wall biosynthesis